MLKVCHSKVHDLRYFMTAHSNLFSSINLVITKYELKSQNFKLTQLLSLTLTSVKVSSQCYLARLYHKIVKISLSSAQM